VRDTVPMTIDEDSSFVISPRTDSLTDVDSLGGTAVIIPFAKHGTTSIDPVTGSVTYKPDTNYVGADTITVVVTDTISGFSDTTLVPINVIPVRDTIYRTINSGGADTLCPPSTTDTDSLGSVTLICGPTLGDTAIDQTTGCVTYSTLSNQFGNDTLCIVTTDINGVSDTTTVIYTILKTIDTIPVIVPEDSTFTLCPPVTTRRPNVDSVAKLCEPTHGTATLDTNGCITYKPDSNYIGYDTICIITIDSNGVADTTIFPITLIPVVDTVPLIVDEDDSIVLCPNTDSTTRVDMLGNVVVDCLPQFGTTTIDSNGCVTYKPFQNFVGVDSFCIIMTDSGGFSDTTYYPITIVPVRDTIIDTLVSDSITFCMPTTTRVDSLGGVSVLCPPSFAVATIIDSVTGCVTYVRDSTYAGNDTLCIVICDTAGVCDTTTVILTVPRIFTPFNVANDSICEGDCVTLMADTMQPGVIYRVHSPRGTIIGRLSTPTVVCPSTDSTFFIEAWDSITGVTSIWDTMTIFVTKFRSPGVSDSISLCETGTIVNLYDSLGTPVIGAKDTTGTWTGPTSLPFGTGYLGAFNPLTDTVGVYTYTIVNPVCPDTSATITVTKYSAPNPGMFDSIALCQSGQSSDLLNSLLGTPDAGGTWAGPVATTNGDLGTLDPSIGIPGRGNYVYTVSKFGCADDSSYVNVWIDTIENDSIRMEDTALCKGLESAQVFIMGATGGTFSTNAMPSDNLNIDPVTGLLTFSNRLPFETRSGQYEVYYTTSGPCPETDTITIDMKVYGEGCQVEIPQFISPNGDGINDVLDIPGIEEFPNNVLKIFNRWGNIVYEKPGYDNTWDGSTNASRGVNQVIGDGDKLPAGTYFYIFESGDDRYPAFSGYVYVK
ncbi:MAG: gliding motility-associated C-terminal domain-containing protein, partial [Flavobacteriales bacterium]